MITLYLWLLYLFENRNILSIMWLLFNSISIIWLYFFPLSSAFILLIIGVEPQINYIPLLMLSLNQKIKSVHWLHCRKKKNSAKKLAIMKHGIGKFRDNKLKVPKAMMTTEKKKNHRSPRVHLSLMLMAHWLKKQLLFFLNWHEGMRNLLWFLTENSWKSEVWGRWPSRLSSWSLPRGENGALFSLDTVRTNVLARVELCWSKEIRWPHLLLLKSGKPPWLHIHRNTGSLLGSRKGMPPSPHNKCCHTSH